ncbi:MAG: hypothetical protein IPM92_08785 [Saprospiraceae bacterium]|nr:hypothetical protein [Saprospiraceae bacterium]
MSIKEQMVTSGKKWWRYIKITFMILVALGLALLLYLFFADYSEGTRTGYVTKISHKGYVFKTYEGELNFGFFGGTATKGLPSDNVWYFSVTNSKVAKDVEEASKSGSKVTLHYKQKYIKISLRGDTEYLVYKVEGLHQAQPATQTPPPANPQILPGASPDTSR